MGKAQGLCATFVWIDPRLDPALDCKGAVVQWFDECTAKLYDHLYPLDPSGNLT